MSVKPEGGEDEDWKWELNEDGEYELTNIVKTAATTKKLPDGVNVKTEGGKLTVELKPENGDTVTIEKTVDGKTVEYTFKVEGGKYYIVIGEEKYEVEFTVVGNETDGYTLTWDYEVPGGAAPSLPSNVEVDTEGGDIKIVTITSAKKR